MESDAALAHGTRATLRAISSHGGAPATNTSADFNTCSRITFADAACIARTASISRSIRRERVPIRERRPDATYRRWLENRFHYPGSDMPVARCGLEHFAFKETMKLYAQENYGTPQP
jgi:hypothetical protein